MIEAYIDGRSFNDQGSGFSVMLRSYSHVWIRGFLCGKKTTNFLDLLAIKFILLSIKDKNAQIILRFRNRYVGHIFAKLSNGSWKKKDLDKHKEFIEEVRNLTLQYPNLKLKSDPDHNIFKDLLSRTEEMVRSKTPYYEK